MTNYIIGGGLAGLIAGYYNPEFTVIAPDVSGFVESKVGRAFVVIHEDEQTLDLFHELEVPSFVKDVQLGYYHHGLGLETDVSRWGDFANTFGEQYLRRKLPEDMQPKDGELGGVPGSSFRGLFVDDNLIDALAEEVDIREGTVTTIREHTINVQGPDDNVEIEWDRLISTIPATICRTILEDRVGWELNHATMTYAELDDVPDRYRTAPWDYLYIVDNVPYHRVVSHVVSNRYFVECRGEPEREAGRFESTIRDWYVHPTGVIEHEDIEPPYLGMTLLGRWAEWDPGILLNDIVRRAQHV